MLFNSVVFLIFLPIVLGLFYVLRTNKQKKIFLILASYVFYGYWDWRFLFLLLISTVVDFVIAQKIDGSVSKVYRKRMLFLSMSVNLGILGFFKYFNFFVDSFSELTQIFGGQLDFIHLNIILPVGISFYTFQTMSYTLDVYNRNIKSEHDFINLALYVSFFPQLVAGPIEKAKHLLPQVKELKKATRENFKIGFILITMGMFKKVLIGDTCGLFVDHIFTEPQYYESYELLAALLLFTIQIYADFSGYTSIGRGIAKLLGINLIHNFKQPYLSTNITEFWRRWHISLSSWLKEYLYIMGLGGNRKGKNRTYVNLMVTMLLGGLWHGASWNFVIWGGLHGVALAVHKIFLGNKSANVGFKYVDLKGFLLWLSKLLMTFLFIIVTWLFFRITDFGDTFSILNKIFEFNWTIESVVLLQITAAYYFVSFSMDVLEYRTGSKTYLLMLKSEIWIGITSALWIVILLYMLSITKPLPFVYFQF